ncbi:hypothetical protein SOVF_128740 [Spinacia oleracea]|nr:hypothetical protein SOVF_128740 [Spinacia oleracea]
MEKKFFGLLLLLLFFFASEMNMVAEVEGFTCSKPSKYFRGFCNNSCKDACNDENWPIGNCVGFLGNKCECRKPSPC